MQNHNQHVCGWFSCLLALVLCAFSLPSSATDVTGQVNVTSLTLVSSTRVGRTLFDYTYQVSLTNSGNALSGVTVTVTSNISSTQIIDGTINVGNLDAGAGAIPTDTITVRQDRMVPFQPTSLDWSLDGTLLAQQSNGVLLSGPPQGLAINALIRRNGGFVDSLQVSGNLILSRLEAVIAPGATIEQTNAALQDIGAGIASMVTGAPLVSIAIPPVSGLATAQQLAQHLVASGAFIQAKPVFAADISEALPDGVVIPLSSAFNHLKLAHAPAAWNLRQYLLHHLSASPTPLLVADIFDRSSIRVSAYADVPINFGSSLITTPGELHGWAVAGVAAAVFDDQLVTGIHPAPDQALSLRGVPLPNASPSVPQGGWIEKMMAIADAFPMSGNFVLNTSLGYNDPHFQFYSAFFRAVYANFWQQLVAADAGRFLHVSSSGNLGSVLDDDSRVGSPFRTAAAYSGTNSCLALDLTGQELSDCQLVQTGAKLTNHLMVGGVTSAEAKDNSSSRPSDVAAQSTNVTVVCVPTVPCDGIGDMGVVSGTSIAAPQIAGLAAFIWGLQPNLTVSELRNLIIGSVRDDLIANDVRQIDGYRAVLNLDSPLVLVGPQNAPMRSAILDVVGSQVGNAGSPLPGVGNGKFDQADLLRFVREFVNRNGAEDFSRFDLNGDGHTGDSRARPISGFAGIPAGYAGIPFDLNANHIISTGAFPSYETYLWDSNVFNVAPSVDEGHLSDWDILCYYAFSSLYEGDVDPNKTDKRLLILLPHLPKCGMVLDRMVLTIRDGGSVWTTTPDAEFSNFGSESSFFIRSSTSSECSFGERGSPIWSAAPHSASASFRPITDILNGAYPVGSSPNRRGCSSFVAYADGRMWVNGTVRRWTITGSSIADREYQTRYFSGNPDVDWSDSSLTLGRVVNPTAGFATEVTPLDFSLNAQVILEP